MADQVDTQSAVLEFSFSDNEEVLDRINESIEEVGHLYNEVILEAIKSLHNGKKSASRTEVFKRVQSIGITEEEVNNSLKLLQDVKVIEIKTIRGRESIRPYERCVESQKVCIEESQVESQKVSIEGLQVEGIEDRIKKLSVNVNSLEKRLEGFKSLEICVESLKSENLFLRSEIRELTGLLEVLVECFKRQNQSTVEKESVISRSDQIIENANYEQILPSQSVNDDNENSFIEHDINSQETSEVSNNITLKEQLNIIRKEYQEKYYDNKSVKNDVNEPTDHKWVENTVLITGDSILNGIDENRLNPQGKVKVRAFPGARIKDMYSYLQPLLVKCPKIIIIHTRTNDALELTSRQIMDKLMELKSFIEENYQTRK